VRLHYSDAPNHSSFRCEASGCSCSVDFFCGISNRSAVFFHQKNHICIEIVVVWVCPARLEILFGLCLDSPNSAKGECRIATQVLTRFVVSDYSAKINFSLTILSRTVVLALPRLFVFVPVGFFLGLFGNTVFGYFIWVNNKSSSEIAIDVIIYPQLPWLLTVRCAFTSVDPGCNTPIGVIFSASSFDVHWVMLRAWDHLFQRPLCSSIGNWAQREIPIPSGMRFFDHPVSGLSVVPGAFPVLPVRYFDQGAKLLG